MSLASLIEESRVLERSGEISNALQMACQALPLARERGEPQALAATLVNLAQVRFRLGQYEAAQALAREAADVAAPDSPEYVDALLSLGACAGIVGSLSEAEGCLRRAVNLARELGHHLLRFRALHNLAAGIYIRSGQFDLALAADEEAYRISRKYTLVDWTPYPLITIAWVGLLTGQRQRARAVLDELAQLVPSGSALQGYQICLAAHLALDERDGETAKALYTGARSIAEATGEPWINVAVRLGMSRCHRLVGNGPEARAWAGDALVFATSVGYHQERGRALIERGRAAWLCGDLDAARADLDAAITTLRDLEAAFDLAHARLLLAALLHQQGHEDASAAWRDAGQTILAGGYASLLEQERPLAFPLVMAYLNSPDSNLASMSTTLVQHLQRAAPEALRIVTLGRFEIWQAGRRIEKQALRRRRAGELLALLLLKPAHRLSIDQAVEALWPAKSRAAAQTAFHHATSALRRALEPDLPDKYPSRYLEVETGQVTLHLPPGSWVDLEAFEEHYRQGAWDDAVALFGGDLLPDYGYADWVLAPRERLALLYQRALLSVAQARLAEGRWTEALDACQRLLDLEPWHEPAVLLGMRACAALGDLAGARRLYLKLEKILREELDTAPQIDLQTFYRSLTPPQSQDPGS